MSANNAIAAMHGMQIEGKQASELSVLRARKGGRASERASE
jgi:hypothetical protein